MEAYYILIVSFLFLLAISLLIVGVSNDAVNFLNSAIGSKAASFKMILTIAALGVLIGATFSNGMMEVARKGIFNPEQFAFSEIMVIFLAVMLTNILLLDFFNTIALPTSTTISIVFGILGAATAVTVVKISGPGSQDSLETYINMESSVLIIVGIFLSIVIAFNAGMIIQWVVRLLFTFNLGKTYRYWAGIWGGFAITVILYFLLIKGAKGSTLVTEEMLSFIKANTARILLFSFAGWTLIFQILIYFTRFNILKITVLVGTFALAMAFAGNDLVNFIGVPLAGFESFKAFMASGSADAGGLRMESLLEPVNTPIFFLIASGLIMVLTLRYSGKARAVTATTIDLSRQDEGSERFASSSLARFIVRKSIEISNGATKITPRAVSGFLKKRFESQETKGEKQEKLAFDLVRASVNLVVASILIAIGTSLKLPLSTTYVTFMVAMGTSLADGAWGRDSAVYRITGVLTVIGGWFFTAFIAFLASFIIAFAIFFGKLPAILFLIGVSLFIMIRTHIFHNKRSRKEYVEHDEVITASYEMLRSCDEQVKRSVTRVSKLLYLTYHNFSKEKHKELKNLRKESRHLVKEVKELQQDLPNTLRKFEENDLVSGHHYVQIVTYMKEMSNSLAHIVQPAFYHLDNNHAFDREQYDRIKEFNNLMGEFFSFVLTLLQNRDYDNMDELVSRRDEMISMANDILLNRIRILKKIKKGVKVSVTYIEMLSETRNLLLHVVQLVKADAKLLQSINTQEDLIIEEVLEQE
ncbi:MAG: inorganic phosphate transporter [Bacteroidales bacterium]